jgi:hypothetical protein
MRLFLAFAVVGIMAWHFSCVAAAQGVIAPCLLKLESDPPGVFLSFGSADSVLSTPGDTLIAAGSYSIEASLTGYQALVHEMNIDPGDTLTLNFILMAEKPVKPTPDVLGLFYQPITPLVPEEQAKATRRNFTIVAEIFAIIPLTQGIMALVALGGSNEFFSVELISAGIFLSAGTYLLGRFMGSRKLKSIREQNNVLTSQNLAAQEHNKDIDIQLRQVHAEAIRIWQADASWRGQVETSH